VSHGVRSSSHIRRYENLSVLLLNTTYINHRNDEFSSNSETVKQREGRR